MKAYDGIGLWVWTATSVSAEATCASLKANKGSWIAVKAHDGTSPYNSQASIVSWKNAAKKHGLKFGIWGYLTAHDPAGEADRANSLIRLLNPDFYIADAEIEYEHSQNASSVFTSEFKKLQPHLNAAFSTFGRLDYHTGINFGAWKQHGFDLMPQAYECESKLLMPDLCVASGVKYGWTRDQIYPTLGSYSGARGVVAGSELFASVQKLGCPGVNVWDAQELHGGQMEALSHLVAKTGPVTKPTPHNPPSQIPITRAFKLTSPYMHGNDVKALQVGIQIRLKNHWQQSSTIKADGVWGPASVHAMALATYDVGLLTTDASMANQRIVRWPWLATPVEVRRAKQRTAAQKKAQDSNGRGLLAVPKIAAKYVNVHEVPSGSNWGTPHPADWEEATGFSHGPWCFAFASAMVRLAGGHVNLGYCPTGVNDAKAHIGGFDMWADAVNWNLTQAGWLVFFSWKNNGVADHVAIVRSINASWVFTVEGNTGGPHPEFGGMVSPEQRPHTNILGYARPKF